MARMTVSLPESTLGMVDEKANSQGIPRSQYVLEALEFYATERIKLKDDIEKLNSQYGVKDKDLELKTSEVLKLQETVHSLENQLTEATQAKNAVDNSLKEVEQYKTKLEQSDAETTQLKSDLAQTQKELEQSRTEAASIKDELEQLKTKYNQFTIDETKRWEELKGIRSENTKLKKDHEASQTAIQQLQTELHNKQAEIDQVVGLKVELATATERADKFRDALKSRDADVEWLKSHVAQLTQQLALPPSEEEAMAKHWYQFWK